MGSDELRRSSAERCLGIPPIAAYGCGDLVRSARRMFSSEARQMRRSSLSEAVLARASKTARCSA